MWRPESSFQRGTGPGWCRQLKFAGKEEGLKGSDSGRGPRGGLMRATQNLEGVVGTDCRPLEGAGGCLCHDQRMDNMLERA